MKAIGGPRYTIVWSVKNRDSEGFLVLLTYTNPVYDGYLADPFVLKHDGQYYAYGTGPASSDGKQFPVLYSRDVISWEAGGWALAQAAGDDFWAPEVAYAYGIFYMYYSASGINGRDHGLRVATSKNPLGPFEDTGRNLVPDQPFSIDAHPFRDHDAQWYLFYSVDFLNLDDNYRVGTGIVVDRMIDMLTLAGNAQVVVRPHADWQLFKKQRTMYGNVYDWYTIEGATLRYHKGRYYCFYSGGAWEHDNYGVAYVVADHPMGPYSRPADLNGPLLRSVAGQVIGPGHNSFVEGPDNQEYIIYHAWDPAMTARRMRIDRLTWDDSTPVIAGPTWVEQTITI